MQEGVTTMSKKKRPKLKVKLNMDMLKRPFLLIAVTLAIVIIGLGIPKVLLSLQTRQAALPKGEVAMDEIQPYGADIIEMEAAVIGSIRAQGNIYEHNDYTYLDTLVADPPGTKTATAANLYSELDLKDRSRKDLVNEFYYEAYSLIQSTFGGALPGTVTISTIEDPMDNSRNVILITDGTSNYAILDPSTGVPVDMMIEVVNQSVPDLDTFWNDLADLYADYLGISFFVNDEDNRYYDWYGDYDSWYNNSALTSDEQLELYVYISSGWYWTPPEYEGDDWHSTDSYVWNIEFSLYEN